MAPLMRDWLIASAVLLVMVFILIGAATVRRLHDGNWSGWWAAPVFAMQLASLASSGLAVPRMIGMIGMIGAIRPDMAPDQVNAAVAANMQSLAGVQLVGMGSLLLTLLLIVFCALPGTEGPNRYGADPLGRAPYPYPAAPY